MIRRILRDKIAGKLHKGKAIIVLGPRQVGKTTLINSILEDREHLFLDGDDITVRNLLTNPNTEEIRSIIGNHTILFIDEAQRIENIGLTMKIITDQFKSVQLLVSGSSAFELGQRTNEPLTGRKWEYRMYPISWKEFEDDMGFLKSEQQLEIRLLYGMYPDVINNPGEEITILKQLTNSFLYKDILSFGGIRKPQVLERLLRALALQMGNEVSFNELAKLLEVDKNTVTNYIDILEKGFVIFRLSSFSRNLRNEIKNNQKIYFYDNGVRNSIIGNFNPLDSRNDTGALWESFLIGERIKKMDYEDAFVSPYFWRTHQQNEIDYIEEGSGELRGFEFKWNPRAKARFHKSFMETYNADIKVVHRKNFREFLM